ncbi:hypothetical protein P280DRAFT_470923 [Massarina eburnea CBS 473.64]|uniref:Uncharacterized protein n=1 Tax=Massarina eburnea CBS 473.64 TaxID=1395130 RepID=A0A6A6RUP2_9PLEO|nr:hypothetical protein P280DRAFT_470923 [Massarina eburnea CBS 473.64]
MVDASTILAAIVYILWWPTSAILSVTRFILAPFWSLLQFFFLPITCLVHAILALVLLPFRVDILERIETIYIWLGIAALVGCATGAAVFLIFNFLTSAFNIDAASQPKPPPQGRTIGEFRSARREKSGTATESSSGPTVVHMAAPRRRGLMSQAIMEEESEF